MHSLLAIALFVLGMVIMTAITFYTKVMIQFEAQNAMEAFYAINGFSLLIITGIIIMKIKMQGREIASQRQAEIEDTKRMI